MVSENFLLGHSTQGFAHRDYTARQTLYNAILSSGVSDKMESGIYPKNWSILGI